MKTITKISLLLFVMFTLCISTSQVTADNHLRLSPEDIEAIRKAVDVPPPDIQPMDACLLANDASGILVSVRNLGSRIVSATTILLAEYKLSGDESHFERSASTTVPGNSTIRIFVPWPDGTTVPAGDFDVIIYASPDPNETNISNNVLVDHCIT